MTTEQHLTAREREVAVLRSQGKTPPEIGEALGLSAGTVKVHLSRVYQKLGIDGAGAARELFLRAKELLGEGA